MSARLHVLVGAGGVGKTTLASGLALALARRGRRVGLLGIDPARRLQGALGIALGDAEVDVPGWGVRAALFAPEECLRRWAAESCADDAARARLAKNTFFLALADRLAGVTDVLAAVRVAEWLERHPDTDDLVVDTAPGLDAVEFLRRPRALAAFLEGRLVTSLRWLARAEGALAQRAATRALGALARIGGARLLLDLAEFVALANELLARMLPRLDVVRAWLASADAEIILVTAPRADAVDGARAIAAALGAIHVAPGRVVLNRAWPDGARAELDALDPRDAGAGGPVVRFARASAELDARVSVALAEIAPVVRVPSARVADLEALSELGARLA